MAEVVYYSMRTLRDWKGPAATVNRFDWCGDCPEIYRNNPLHPEVDALGFRTCQGARPSPQDEDEETVTILILGDSVTYGYGLDCEMAFPHLLAGVLNGATPDGTDRNPFRVINGGVAGYGTYNELQLYKGVGRNTDPDVVVLVLVLNDVANPRLHWAEGGRRAVDIPAAALPNPQYDEDHAKPVLAQWRREQSWRRFLVGRVVYRLQDMVAAGKRMPAGPGGWPTAITGEDDLAITVLTDRRCPESRWLNRMLALLQESVTGDGARLAVMIVPLSYQLDPDYPHEPQANIRDMCRELGVPCLDLLPAFREHEGDSLFLGEQGQVEDIWHLAPTGHLLTARCLRDFLLEAGLTAGPTDPSAH